MNLIILAAGRGRRLDPYTTDKPKLLIKLKGGTLLSMQIDSFKASASVTKAVYVLGYLAHDVENQLHKVSGIKTQTIFNPFYEITNNLASLWMARGLFDNDFAVINGDNLLHNEDIARILKKRNGIYVAVNKKSDLDNDDMKVLLGRGGISKISKTIDEHTTKYESVGFVVVSGKKYRTAFKDSLDKLVRSRDYITDRYWLEVLNLLAENGETINPVVIKKKWFEFDFHRDIDYFNISHLQS